MIAFAISPGRAVDGHRCRFGETPPRFLGVPMIGLFPGRHALLEPDVLALPPARRPPSSSRASPPSSTPLIWRGEWPTITMVIGFTILLVGVMCPLYVFGKSPPRRRTNRVRARPREGREA
ncbi:MAG: hypothetical protein ACLUHG_02010 [Sutterella wadsworthensis]